LKKRHKLAGSLTVGLALIMAACAGQVTPTPSSPEPEAPILEREPVTESAPEPITLTDDLGREVTLEGTPGRIVSLAPAVTEDLYAIGAGELLVGRTDFDNYPPQAEDLPSVGGFAAEDISVETIVALEPDLVLGGATSHEVLAEQLGASGIPLFVFDPVSIDDVYANLETMGRITGHQTDAQAVIQEMQARIQAVQDAVADVPDAERPAVFYEVWDEPLMTAGPNTFVSQMVELAGGVNIFTDAAEDYPIISQEVILERAPDVILGPTTHGETFGAEVVAARPGWDSLPAVQAGRVYVIDGDTVSRPGPRIAEAVELIAAALYPDRFTGD
jgi:iron complex transport system substrate-binding protein